jgi:glucose/arabinose dehydrogenase
MRSLLLFLAGAAWAAGLSVCGEDRSPLAALQAVSPSFKGEALSTRDYKVFEWVLGPNRQRTRKPVEPGAVYAFGDTYYVEQRRPPRWLVGRLPRRGQKVIECEAHFASLKELLDASAFAPLPRPPAGFTLREVVRLPAHPTRLASDGRGKVLYVLCASGDVWRVEPGTGTQKQVLRGEDYTDRQCVDRLLVGMTLDSTGRLYLVANERDDRGKLVMNRVTIYRTMRRQGGDPADPKPWLKTSYPWGIGPFNHGVGHIAFGPDGLLYINSGSRTDGNETGNDPRYSAEGEAPLTACLWRLDPRAKKPAIEVHARGLRNAYGFCWNDRGEMFATENGPDADPPEELNLIRKGAHYGFPFRFADWKKPPYPHTPKAPPGLTFEPPIANLGPDGGGSQKKPMYTFDPHSSPSGIVFLGEDFPRPYRGTFLVARFGNLLDRPRVGFDVLHVALSKDAKGRYQARCRRLLSPIARPVDLHLSGKGKVYICEYSRQIENKGYNGMLPGRVLELAVKSQR